MFFSNRMSSKFHNVASAMLFFSVTSAFSAPTPLDYEFYSKFPDHGDTKMAPPIAPPPLPEGIYIGLQRFHELLTRMREARDHLRTDCIGSNSSKMTSRVRGTDVLIWPERFKECEAHARLLDEGNPLFETALKQWNKALGSNYTLPRGDPADVQAWNRQKAGIKNFPQLGCDDASRSIVLFGQPGLTEAPEQVFKRMKSRCPKQWILLFEPEEDISKKAEAAKRICRPGSTYYASDDKSATGTIEMCDESDKFVPKGKSDGKDQNSGRKSGSESDDDLSAELNAIGKGNYPKWGTKLPDDEKQAKMIIQARRSSGSHIVAGMEEGVRNQPKAGEIGGVAILGGETGKMLETLADTNLAIRRTRDDPGGGAANGTGCDDAAYAQSAQAWINSKSAAIKSMQIEQQQCALARLHAEALQKDIAYAQRCNKQSSVPALRSALADTQQQARQLCGGG